MVSFTKQTERRRRIRQRAQGRRQAARRVRAGTPKFPVHPEGYDQSAPDARRPTGSQGSTK